MAKKYGNENKRVEDRWMSKEEREALKKKKQNRKGNG